MADVMFACNKQPYTIGYPWYSGIGFGARYGHISPYLGSGTDYPWSVQFIDETDVIFANCYPSHQLRAFRWQHGVGFGTAYGVPSISPGSGTRHCHRGISDELIVTPYFAYVPVGIKFTPGVGFGTAYGTSYGTTGLLDAFCKASGDAVAGACNNYSPDVFVKGWPWTYGVGNGAPFSDPSPYPDYGGHHMRVHGNVAILGEYRNRTYPYVGPVTPPFWGFTISSVGWGTSVWTPGYAETGAYRGMETHVVGNDIFIGFSPETSIIPFQAWKWTGSGFGTKYSDPSTWDTDWGSCVCITHYADLQNCDIILGMGIGVSVNNKGAAAYKWNPGVGWGVKYSDPQTVWDYTTGATMMGVSMTEGVLTQPEASMLEVNARKIWEGINPSPWETRRNVRWVNFREEEWYG